MARPQREHDTGLRLDAVALDLNPLQAALFEEDGLSDGTWDVVFVNTDWIAELVERELVIDLAPIDGASSCPRLS